MSYQIPDNTTVSGELLDEKAACEYLKQTPRTLRLWRAKRGLPHIRITNKVIIYRKPDVDRWLMSFRTVRSA
jgi:hypothetical protein